MVLVLEVSRHHVHENRLNYAPPDAAQNGLPKWVFRLRHPLPLNLLLSNSPSSFSSPKYI